MECVMLSPECRFRWEKIPAAVQDSVHKAKLAADETQSKVEEGDVEQADEGPDCPAGRDSPGPRGKIVRVELEWEIPMSVTLPVEVQPDPAHQPFPFLDTTLADLGIQESEVKERVVWVDTKKTQVKNKAGKLKEKEITILEVRVKAQKPGDKQLQEVLYSTEAHTDRSFCRTGMDILPWKQISTGLERLQSDTCWLRFVEYLCSCELIVNVEDLFLYEHNQPDLSVQRPLR
ncbi:uncharacterized protein AB9X84_026004 [Acanthopagrus schlegelii]